MRLTSFARRRMLAGLAVLAGMTGGGAVLAQPANPNAAATSDVKIDKTGALIVPLGGVVRFDLKSGDRLPTEFTIRNDDVVLVRSDLTNPRVLLLTGKQAGLTQLIVTYNDKTSAKYDVLVQPDYDLLRKVIRQAVPTANVEVIPGVGNVIILTGYVNKPEDSDTVLRITSSAVGGSVNNVINALQLGGAQHVLIDCTIAQVDRTELRERNFSFGVAGKTVGFSSVLGGLATSNVAANSFGGINTTPPLAAGAGANLVLGIVPSSTLGALRALRTEGIAKFLSEPKVITQTGRPAILRAGGQQAILGSASGINGPGAELRDVGTTLEVLPIVFGNGKIALEVVPLIRTVNAGRGVTTSFGFTPGFNESSVRSSVVMESGQTYAIGGLLETQVQGSVQKVPYLGDMPLLSAAFSSISYEERETELIILVTPRLVDAMGCNQVPLRVPGKETRTPDDYELFLESLIEAPRGQRQPWVNGKYVPAYKNDRSASQYPCIGADGKVIPGCASPAAPASATSCGMPVAAAPCNNERCPRAGRTGGRDDGNGSGANGPGRRSDRPADPGAGFGPTVISGPADRRPARKRPHGSGGRTGRSRPDPSEMFRFRPLAGGRLTVPAAPRTEPRYRINLNSGGEHATHRNRRPVRIHPRIPCARCCSGSISFGWKRNVPGTNTSQT